MKGAVSEGVAGYRQRLNSATPCQRQGVGVNITIRLLTGWGGILYLTKAETVMFRI
jgi:hypothetical protein